MSRFVAYGIDLADESPAWGLNQTNFIWNAGLRYSIHF